jgi:hypothetical protein
MIEITYHGYYLPTNFYLERNGIIVDPHWRFRSEPGFTKLDWGHVSPGATLLAYLLLGDCGSGDVEVAVTLHEAFCLEVISKLPRAQPWKMTHREIAQWIKSKEDTTGTPAIEPAKSKGTHEVEVKLHFHKQGKDLSLPGKDPADPSSSGPGRKGGGK